MAATDVTDAGGHWSDDTGDHVAYLVLGDTKQRLLDVLGGEPADSPSVRQSTGPDGSTWFELWRWEGVVRTSPPGQATGPDAVRGWLAGLR